MCAVTHVCVRNSPREVRGVSGGTPYANYTPTIPKTVLDW